MSDTPDTNEEVPVEPSKFGKRLGWAVSFALVVLAVLVAVITFSGSGNNTIVEPVQSSNPFK